MSESFQVEREAGRDGRSDGVSQRAIDAAKDSCASVGNGDLCGVRTDDASVSDPLEPPGCRAKFTVEPNSVQDQLVTVEAQKRRSAGSRSVIAGLA
jgi:hypothetical protein